MKSNWSDEALSALLGEHSMGNLCRGGRANNPDKLCAVEVIRMVNLTPDWAVNAQTMNRFDCDYEPTMSAEDVLKVVR
jgi:hypothetical protein